MLEFERLRENNSGQRGTATARAAYPTPPVQAQATPDQEVAATPQLVPRKTSVPVLVPQQPARNYQIRLPVIVGEASYKGMLPVDGVVSGQLGGGGGSLAVRQKSGAAFSSGPELSGEISFRDVVRVYGHIAGTVYSENGTLIIDDTARVDANIEVAVAEINGTINGDIVAHRRVQIGSGAKIYGNIWTRSIAIKDGAVFEGVCNMIED